MTNRPTSFTSLFTTSFLMDFKLVLGVIAGALFTVSIGATGVGDRNTREGIAVLVVVSVLMMMVGLLSCVVPAMRGLRIQPTEALRQRG